MLGGRNTAPFRKLPGLLSAGGVLVGGAVLRVEYLNYRRTLLARSAAE